MSEAPTDRELLEKVAADYRELRILENSKSETMGKMIRACLQRIKSPDSRKRAEGIKGLEDLAVMLETPRG